MGIIHSYIAAILYTLPDRRDTMITRSRTITENFNLMTKWCKTHPIHLLTAIFYILSQVVFVRLNMVCYHRTLREDCLIFNGVLLLIASLGGTYNNFCLLKKTKLSLLHKKVLCLVAAVCIVILGSIANHLIPLDDQSLFRSVNVGFSYCYGSLLMTYFYHE